MPSYLKRTVTSSTAAPFVWSHLNSRHHHSNGSDRLAHQQILSLRLCLPLFITHHFLVHLRILSQEAPRLHHRAAAGLPVSQLYRTQGMHADSGKAPGQVLRAPFGSECDSTCTGVFVYILDQWGGSNKSQLERGRSRLVAASSQVRRQAASQLSRMEPACKLTPQQHA